MKNILPVIFCLCVCYAEAQKISTRNGKIHFSSKAKLMNIDAHNSTAVSVIDKSNGNIEFAVLMKGFEFERALMQEHFNDDYVESDKYPKSTFKGSITNFSTVDFTKNGIYNISVTGNLSLHGITKPLTAQGQLKLENGFVYANSEFNIMLSDYNIKIPSMVSGDISNNIKIRINFKYN